MIKYTMFSSYLHDLVRKLPKNIILIGIFITFIIGSSFQFTALIQDSSRININDSTSSKNTVKPNTDELSLGIIYTPHAPILIAGDAGFATCSCIASGNGSYGNPYLIEYYSIAGYTGPGINITGTTKYFDLYYVIVANETGSGVTGSGFYLSGNSHGSCSYCTAESNQYDGFYIAGSTVQFQLSTAYNNSVNGFQLYSDSFAAITYDNSYNNGLSGYVFSYCSHLVIENNNAHDNNQRGITGLTLTDYGGYVLSFESQDSFYYNTATEPNLIGVNVANSNSEGIYINTIISGICGFNVISSSNNYFTSNNVTDSQLGFDLYLSSSDNQLDSNIVTFSAGDGYLIEDNSNNTGLFNDSAQFNIKNGFDIMNVFNVTLLKGSSDFNGLNGYYMYNIAGSLINGSNALYNNKYGFYANGSSTFYNKYVGLVVDSISLEYDTAYSNTRADYLEYDSLIFTFKSNNFLNPATIPGKVTSIVALNQTNQIKLSWVAPASDGGTNITVYTIYRSLTNGSFSYVTVVNTLYFVDTSVTVGVTYYYQINAVNIEGPGPLSKVVFGTALPNSITTTTITTSSQTSSSSGSSSSNPTTSTPSSEQSGVVFIAPSNPTSSPVDILGIIGAMGLLMISRRLRRQR